MALLLRLPALPFTAVPHHHHYQNSASSPTRSLSTLLSVSRPGVQSRLFSLPAGPPSVFVSLVSQVEEGNTSESNSGDVVRSVSLLKTAAKTRKTPAVEVFQALRTIEKAKLDPSNFLQTIGGRESPGRTWMLVFTAGTNVVRDALKGGPGGGQYFPITAVQRFDATAMRIENGVFLGPLGFLTFEGRFSWKKRILAFVFENVNIKIGNLGPFKFKFGFKEDDNHTPGVKDPFFSWFYADDEIIVAKGRGGGIAFWCRCAKVSQ